MQDSLANFVKVVARPVDDGQGTGEQRSWEDGEASHRQAAHHRVAGSVELAAAPWSCQRLPPYLQLEMGEGNAPIRG